MSYHDPPRLAKPTQSRPMRPCAVLVSKHSKKKRCLKQTLGLCIAYHWWPFISWDVVTVVVKKKNRANMWETIIYWVTRNSNIFFGGGNFHPDPLGFHDDSNLTISYFSDGLVQPSNIPWLICNFWIHVGRRLKEKHSVYGFRCLKNTWKPVGGWYKHRQSLTSYTRFAASIVINGGKQPL